MKRRKFLKLLSYSPFMFLVPGVLVRKKPQSIKLSEPSALWKRLQGSYIGNGKGSQTITGIGFQPKYIMVYPGDKVK